MKADIELSILMPCLDEAETVGQCVRKAQAFLTDHNVVGEVIIADNGSQDGSPEVAESAGARVVHVSTKGYGAALQGGIEAANGQYVIMGDADDSYDFSALMPFLDQLRAGFDLVMGDRFSGGIEPGAMPFLHRYLGNPLLSEAGRLFFNTGVRDFHCGLRGFKQQSIQALDLRTTGMEFASEMVVKASLHGLRITEVSTILYPDGRSRRPHLRTWRDGWRHLRFLLLFSPDWLFLYPGILLMIIGTLFGAWLLTSPRTVGNIILDVNTLFYMALLVIIGFQFVNFSVFTRKFGISEGLLPESDRFGRLLKHFTLERGLLVGAILIVTGILGSILAVTMWQRQSFGPLDTSLSFRLVIPGGTLLMIGFQTILSSFFLSILDMGRR
jgi:glycosyltransferase involved in cell wall biosynthesis